MSTLMLVNVLSFPHCNVQDTVFQHCTKFYTVY